jgi:hypothetical protein
MVNLLYPTASHHSGIRGMLLPMNLSPEDAARIQDAERQSVLRVKADTEIGWRQDAVDADIATDEESSQPGRSTASWLCA